MIRRSGSFVTGRSATRKSDWSPPAGIIADCPQIETAMEAEQVNQIQTSLSSLSVRAAELRRYL